MLHLGRTTPPEVGRDRLAARGKGPAVGQVGEMVPRGRAEHPMPEGHDQRSIRRGQEGVHGCLLHEDQGQGVAMILTELIGPWRLLFGCSPNMGKKRETNDIVLDMGRYYTKKLLGGRL